MCCSRLKKTEWSCMRCGVEVSGGDPKVRSCLWYGRKVKFCRLNCQRAWLEEWFGVSANLEKV